MDSVASLYGRNQLESLIADTAREVFIPITVGGGIRSVDDAKKILRAGADKVAINTAAIASPILISEVAKKFGSQCMVLSIEAKRIDQNSWEAFTDGGRERSGLDVVDWAKKAVSLGAGEILLTSVDNEGTGKGFDLDLIKAVSSEVNVPIIASGGFGEPRDAANAYVSSGADAVAIAGAFHYKKISLSQIQETLKLWNISFRAQRL
jgi:cyclase